VTRQPGRAAAVSQVRTEAFVDTSCTTGSQTRIRALLLYSEPVQLTELVQRLPADRFEVAACPVSTTAGWLEDLRPDVVLMTAPGQTGPLVAACEAARAETDAPLVVLSKLADESAIARALATGIDEYLVLPIGDLELVARVEALLRRLRRHRAFEETLQIGDLVLSTADHIVTKAGQRIVLSPIEFRLLLCLASAPGKVFTHETLMSRVWGAEYVDARHYLYLYVRYLREKLEDEPTRPELILSEWGVGYSLRAPSIAPAAGQPNEAPVSLPGLAARKT